MNPWAVTVLKTPSKELRVLKEAYKTCRPVWRQGTWERHLILGEGQESISRKCEEIHRTIWKAMKKYAQLTWKPLTRIGGEDDNKGGCAFISFCVFFNSWWYYQLALNFWQAVDRTDKLRRNITFSSVCLARKSPFGTMHSGMKFGKKIVADLIKKGWVYPWNLMNFNVFWLLLHLKTVCRGNSFSPYMPTFSGLHPVRLQGRG